MSRVQKIPGVKVVGGLAGLNIMSFSNKSNVGTIFVMLETWATGKQGNAVAKYHSASTKTHR